LKEDSATLGISNPSKNREVSWKNQRFSRQLFDFKTPK
jgi:hypothetical protein